MMIHTRFALALLVFLLLRFEPTAAQNIDLLKSAIPYRKGNLWGYANPENKQILVPPVYDSVAYPLASGLPPLVYKNGACGLFAFYKNKDSLEVLIPMGQEKILKTFNENYIVKINIGDSTNIEVDAYLKKEFKGIVTSISNSACNAISADHVTNF
jgi:hypothetical protein